MGTVTGMVTMGVKLTRERRMMERGLTSSKAAGSRARAGAGRATTTAAAHPAGLSV